MNLDKLAVGILRALLITSRSGAARADHRVCRFTEDESWSTGRDDHCVSGKRAEFERLEVHRDQSAANLVIVKHERHHFPVLKLSHFTVHFITAYLFIKRVEQLLPG